MSRLVFWSTYFVRGRDKPFIVDYMASHIEFTQLLVQKTAIALGISAVAPSRRSHEKKTGH